MRPRGKPLHFRVRSILTQCATYVGADSGIKFHTGEFFTQDPQAFSGLRIDGPG
jgi:hypothetical protein